MGRDGLRRRNKPFPGASDLHLPIADSAIEKLKPYYVNSVFSRQLLASFTSLAHDLGDASAAAAEFCDYKIRKESNYPRQFGYFCHWMLGSGRGLLKVRWDSEARGGKGCLSFDAIDPVYFITTGEVDDPDEMDLFAHVRQISVAKYKRSKVYVQDSELIALIRGGDNQASQWKDQEKEFREGITGSTKEDVIILWETWERVEEGWKVRTFSPSQPDRPVRPPFVYDVKWQGDAQQPFVAGQIELTEKGWYAPRGVSEKVAPYEAYGSKVWNASADWLEYANKPLFERDPSSPLVNHGRQTIRPGEILPPGIRPVTMPAPPFKLDEEINRVRQLSEELLQVPDFGVSPDGNEKDTRTATEMQYIGSFASQGVQYRAWINGLFEGQIYRKAWALLVKYAKEDLTYFASKERKVMPAQALHDNYLVEPDASPDAWNKPQRVQRSIARFQMFAGHPNVNQEALVRSVLQDDDPRLVKELFISTRNKAASESEHEAMQIQILQDGFPASVMPGEDHQLRLRILFGKFEQLGLMPPPSTPEEQQRMFITRTRMQEHIAAHMEALQQENPALAKQFMGAIQAVDPMAQPADPLTAGAEGALQPSNPMVTPPAGSELAPGMERMAVA
jgi:hypothetical protein